MEGELQARDRIGVQDFVLLEDFQSEEAFLENLRKRYNSGLIYVSTRTSLKFIKFWNLRPGSQQVFGSQWNFISFRALILSLSFQDN